jgi:peptidoglycan-associated lipoprotein
MRPTSHPCRLALSSSLLCGLLTGGCSSERSPPLFGSVRDRPAPVVIAAPKPVATPGGAQPGAVGSSGTSSSSSSAAAAALAAIDEDTSSVIYFDPDGYLVKDNYRPMLEAHAKRLIADPRLRLRIDGHTDGIGPADYNLELARTRAQMVMKQLVSMGVPPNQLQIVGHGKGATRTGGANAQAANRRVELTYR